MFFIICPGYPPVAFDQKSEVEFTSLLPSSNTFCVFADVILENQFANVLVRLDESNWEQLGVLTPNKLSAFFKTKGLIVQEIGIQIQTGIPPLIQVNTNTSLTLTSHIARRLITHLENYISSFCIAEMVPISVFQNWMTTVEHKLSKDPNFLE
eukprot:NODE_43_length_28809_cov_0.237200.p17 type:complete len:153 gc:universal NODE_43_length_28809_cov_0.237200:8844-9302(+)